MCNNIKRMNIKSLSADVAAPPVEIWIVYTAMFHLHDNLPTCHQASDNGLVL